MLPLSGRDATPDNASVKADGPPDIIIRDGGDYATKEDSPRTPRKAKKGRIRAPTVKQFFINIKRDEIFSSLLHTTLPCKV